MNIDHEFPRPVLTVSAYATQCGKHTIRVEFQRNVDAFLRNMDVFLYYRPLNYDDIEWMGYAFQDITEHWCWEKCDKTWRKRWLVKYEKLMRYYMTNIRKQPWLAGVAVYFTMHPVKE